MYWNGLHVWFCVFFFRSILHQLKHNTFNGCSFTTILETSIIIFFSINRKCSLKKSRTFPLCYLFTCKNVAAIKSILPLLIRVCVYKLLFGFSRMFNAHESILTKIHKRTHFEKFCLYDAKFILYKTKCDGTICVRRFYNNEQTYRHQFSTHTRATGCIENFCNFVNSA